MYRGMIWRSIAVELVYPTPTVGLWCGSVLENGNRASRGASGQSCTLEQTQLHAEGLYLWDVIPTRKLHIYRNSRYLPRTRSRSFPSSSPVGAWCSMTAVTPESQGLSRERGARRATSEPGAVVSPPRRRISGKLPAAA